MTKRTRRSTQVSQVAEARPALPRTYRRAARMAQEGGDNVTIRRTLTSLRDRTVDVRIKALITNDLAALSAREGDLEAALAGFHAALTLDPDCQPAQLNLALLDADSSSALEGQFSSSQAAIPCSLAPSPAADGPVRVAVLSFLFNWPSTGGGIVHTVELAKFLQNAGFDIQHIYARYEAWGIGGVAASLPFHSKALEFNESTWNLAVIQSAFRRAVDEFDPDAVIITDSWNSKPILAEAVRGYPYFLRLQALECLCPLNNVRLLPGGMGGVRQCPNHQFANHEECLTCLDQHGGQSGSLHQAERALCGVESAAYHHKLLGAFRDAEAVLVVNPLTEAMLSPYARSVRTVTAGMDPARFPWPWQTEPEDGRSGDGRTTLLFAGLMLEPMKGFTVLHEACSRLWDHRQDFELIVTDDPPQRIDSFTRLVGWQTQEELPRFIRAADMLIVPTIAQEALGRTAVEAMAAGRPVVASRLGGIPFTVADGSGGLLCEPGNPEDLARKITVLLDDAAMRERMGHAGRRRVEEHYAWPVIIERHYRPLLRRRDRERGKSTTQPARIVRTPRPPYTPFIPQSVDLGKLATDLASFVGVDTKEVEEQLQRYAKFHEEKGYAHTLGELKTLCFEEAFVLAVLMRTKCPRVVAEVGVQEGKSSRRIVDLISFLGLDCRLIGFDVCDQRRHIAPVEMELVIGDVTGQFRQRILRTHNPDLIFLDIHSYHTLKEAITASMEEHGPYAVAIHDCGRGLCNPRMTLDRDTPNVSSITGVWERHVLAELFDIDDPLSPQLDGATTSTHELRIFDTPHGLGVIVPKPRVVSH